MPPLDFFKKLSKFYSPEHDLPVISTKAAALLSILFTLLYVLPFYLSPSTRPSPTLNRDAPSVIRARIRAVSLACLITTTTTLILVVEGTSTTPVDGLHLLGWWPIFPVESVLAPLLLTLILFLGPLFEKLLIETSLRPFTLFQEVPASLRSHIGYRNFVAGPITEEVLFRSCLIPLQLLARSSPTIIIFTTPLYFGIAHIHHLYEFTLTHPDHSWVPILLRSFFQFTYTTLFGWFASFVYLRTGSLYACVLIHTFCNWAGFPRVWGKVQRRDSFVAVGPYGPVARGKEDASGVTQVRRVEEPALVWTLVYYVLLLAGAWGFYLLFWPLTESGNALVTFGTAAAKAKAKKGSFF